MALTDDLISQFVKITNDKEDVKQESTVYGTIKVKDGRTFVRLDGASDDEILTPVTAAANAIEGERVTVMIKNHTAIVTGNLSSPLARSGDVTDAVNETIHEFQDLLAKKVSTEELDAERARIDTLVADNATIKGLLEANDIDVGQLQADYVNVSKELTAVQASIENLDVGKLDAEIAKVTYATITDLDATNIDVHNLEATYGDFASLTADRFTATEARIDALQADKLDAETAKITYAAIADLDAINAEIDNLSADVADIDTLIFGSATGDVIQTSFANAVIAQLGDAQIKSAMIENIAADKILAGDIITNNVRVRSEDGSLMISDETLQISDASRVRVQIGKDAAGDYSINIWDQNGYLMFSKGGITDRAIKDAIIRNDMVSDTANISAHKLNIDSLFEEINGSTNTIKSTQIYLDDEKQTLDVVFKELDTTVTDLGSTVSSQGTQISAVQGQISGKVWQHDIDAATGELSTQYSTLEQEVDSISTTVASHTSQIAAKADSSVVTTINNKVTSLETDLDGVKTTVSNQTSEINKKADSSTVTEIGDKVTTLETTLDGVSATVASHTTEINEKADSSTVTEVSNKVTTLETNLEGVKTTVASHATAIDKKADSGTVTEIGNKVTILETTLDGVKASVTSHTTDIAGKADNSAVTAVSNKVSELEQNVDGFKTTVSETYATKTEVGTAIGDATTDIDNLDKRITTTESSITQLSDKITTNVTDISNLGTRMSTVEQTAGGLTVRLDTIETDIDTAQSTANAAKKQLYHSASGTSGTAGYVGICTIKVTGNYTNRPILFELNNRGRQSSNVSFCFENVNSTDPSLSHLQYDGGIYIWAYKTATSTWSLIAQKSEAYDTVYVKDFCNNNDAVTVTWTNVHYDSLPTSNITAGTLLAGKITKATVDNAAKTATNYLNFSSSGLVVGDMTASTLGKNVLIDSDSVDIRNGDKVLASFGAKEVTLGQNAADSVINLCDGAATIKALISESSNSYPAYDSMQLDSQKIVMASKDTKIDTSADAGSWTNAANIRLVSQTGSGTASSALKSETTVVTSGNNSTTGMFAQSSSKLASTYTQVYSTFKDVTNNTTTSNSMRMYPNNTIFDQPIVINGTYYRGTQKVLWTGGFYMTETHTITLSESISVQPTGIVLTFSRYADGASQNNNFNHFFVPKEFVSSCSGYGSEFTMMSNGITDVCHKYLYITDTTIRGHTSNDATGTGSGVTYANNKYVLRRVVGV